MIEYLEKVIAASSVEAVWALHTDKMASFGFDRLLYGFTRHRTETSLGSREDMMVLSNHAPSYIERFINDGLYARAPGVRWAKDNVGAKSWRWMAEQFEFMSPEEKEVMLFNRDMGVTTGYTISFPENTATSKAAIALTARQGMNQDAADAVWAEHGRDIIVMNNVAHMRLADLPYSGARRALTKRQREALEWVGSGKTTLDTAILMGLTPATVEKHLRLAREALDVETTAHAVLKASVHNQIFVIGA